MAAARNGLGMLHHLVILAGFGAMSIGAAAAAAPAADFAASIVARLSPIELSHIRILSARRWALDGILVDIRCSQDCKRLPPELDWNKLFLKIADVTSSRIDRVTLRNGCIDFQFSEGRISPEPTCTGSTATSSILRPKSSQGTNRADTKSGDAEIGQNAQTSALGSASSGLPLSQHITIIQIEKELTLQLNSLNIVPKVLERSEHHFRLLVEGMRDVVLPGEGVWERLTMFVVISPAPAPAAEFVMHLVADGHYAGGLGSPPAASSYTNSMEPKYYKPLDEFTKALAARVTQAINGR